MSEQRGNTVGQIVDKMFEDHPGEVITAYPRFADGSELILVGRVSSEVGRSLAPIEQMRRLIKLFEDGVVGQMYERTQRTRIFAQKLAHLDQGVDPQSIAQELIDILDGSQDGAP